MLRFEASPAKLDWMNSISPIDYARQQGWLVESGKAFSTILTPTRLKIAVGE